MTGRLTAFRQATLSGTALLLLAENSDICGALKAYAKPYCESAFPSQLRRDNHPAFHQHEPRREMIR